MTDEQQPSSTDRGVALTREQAHRVLEWHYDRAAYDYPTVEDYDLARSIAEQIGDKP